jgi:hypothetical protein
MRIICVMNLLIMAPDTQCNSHRRVRAASDGAGLHPARRVAAAGDRFPPGDPRRPRFPRDCLMRERVNLRGDQT